MDDGKKTNINDLLNQVIDAFKEPEKLVTTIAETQRWVTPASKWSISNQMLLVLANTRDARGMQQWNEVGRRVKKGSKAIHILVPHAVEKEVEEEVTNQGGTKEIKISKVPVSITFRPVPVFRVEDTLGYNTVARRWEDVPLTYEPRRLPSLMDKAEAWGIQVHYTAMEKDILGTFAPGPNKIRLSCEAPWVFYHELAHAAHHRTDPDEFKGIPNWKKEAVAELAANVLAILYEDDYPTPSSASYNYIQGYAEDTNGNVPKLCMSVLKDTEKVLNEILDKQREPRGRAKESQYQCRCSDWKW